MYFFKILEIIFLFTFIHAETASDWLTDIFPKKINKEDVKIFHPDKKTGCRMLQHLLDTFYIYGDSCTSVPSDMNVTTESVFIRATKVTKIKTGHLSNWPNLESLNIETNPDLVHIEAGAFSNLEKLTNLSISNNDKLSYIDPNTFYGLKNLKSLKFIKNNIKSLLSITMSIVPNVLPKLNFLDLSENFFPKIYLKDMIPLTTSQIKVLSFVFCGIQEVEKHSFKQLSNLESLFLDKNNLNSATLVRLVSDINQTSPKFNELSISSNLLYEFPRDLLYFISRTNITVLDLKNNRFSLNELELIPPLPNIKKLDLTGIALVNIENGLLNDRVLPNLENLILAKNNIPGLSKRLTVTNLKRLDITDNKCENCISMHWFKITNFAFANMRKLRFLNLSKNPIYHVTNEMFYGLKNLEILHLSNCSLYRIDDHSFIHFINLKHLDLSFNRFFKNSSIRGETFIGLIHLESLRLDSCEIYSIADSSLLQNFPKLKYLTLRNNHLTEIYSSWFSFSPELTLLDISYNAIREWNEQMFNEMNGLKELYLASNELVDLNYNMLKEFTNLKHLDLSGNPLDCSCELVIMIHGFLRNENKTIDQLRLNDTKNHCLTPRLWANKEIITFLSDRLDRRTCDRNVASLVLFLFLGAAVICMVTAVLVYYFRWHLRYWIFLIRQTFTFNYFPKKKNNHDSTNEYRYDAFVSYSHEDRNFVIRLVSTLELNQPNFKLCVFERDFNVGDVITESVVDCISSSRKIILVLSDSFAKSTWCLWEMQLAQHKRLFYRDQANEPLVIIKLGEIMERHMTPTLRYLIRTRVHLQWNSDAKKQKIFWQKLREALNHSRCNI